MQVVADDQGLADELHGDLAVASSVPSPNFILSAEGFAS